MTLLLKDPAATLDYAVDWGAEYLGDDTLASSDWSVRPAEVGGIAVVESGFEGTVASVTVNGGIAGRVYRLSNQVQTNLGRQDRRSIVLRVDAR